MRDIKFRYSAAKDGAWVHGDFDFGANMEWVVKDWVERNGLEWAAVVKRQYVGLHDKNGVEIYEGDVWLGDDGFRRSVVWHADDAAFRFKVVDSGGLHGMAGLTTEGRVVGSIYEEQGE